MSSAPVVAVLLSALLCSPALAAEGPVFPINAGLVGQSPERVAVGDLDGDGYGDMALAVQVSFGTQNVLLRRNLGDGTFATLSTLVVGQTIRQLTLRDVDQDGKIDLVLAIDSGALRLVAIHHGNGDGSLGALTLVTLSGGPVDVDFADLDGDGDLDLVAPTSLSGRVSVALANGLGGFSPAVEFGAGSTPAAVALGDLNGDGNADAVLANKDSGNVSSLLGNGAGGLGSPIAQSLGGKPVDVALGDFDGDGDLDLAVANDTFAGWHSLPGLGNGSFGAATLHNSVGVTSRVKAADLDEDGLADVVHLTKSPAVVGAALSLGVAGFAPAAKLKGQAGALDLAVGDMTADGDLDLITCGYGFLQGNAVYLEGRGDGSFGHAYYGHDGCSDVRFGDLDGDGLDDMLLVNEFSDDMTVYPGTGNGFFGVGTDVFVGDIPASGDLADFNGDGDRDVAIAHATTGGGVSLLFGDGALGFSAPVAFAAGGGQTRTLKALDVDLDGDVDVLVVNRGNNTFAVLRNNGAGVLSAAELQATTSMPFDLALGDVDGDGDVDAAVCSSTGVLHIYKAIGGGFFDSALSFTVGTGGDGLALGDLDGDGDLDAALTSVSGVTVAFNTGTGLFTGALALLTGGTNCDGVVIADFDRDGKADLAVTNSSSGGSPGSDSIGVLLGDGAGGFGPAVEHFGNNLPRRLTGVDVNGDGALDLAAPGYGDGVVILLNQRGPWTHLGHGLAGVAGVPRQVGSGTLVGTDPFAFTLTDARPNALVGHILGLSEINAPFKGGVFVPSPDLINQPLGTDASGTAVVAGPWFPGLSGITFSFQFWVVDPGAIKGFAASNAVRALVP